MTREAWQKVASGCRPLSGVVDEGQGDAEPEPGRAGDATVRDVKHASVPLRRVHTGELRWEKFLYILKAGPAGGRLRRPSSAGSDATATGLPASPSPVRPSPRLTDHYA
jgi:hypothetical protein